MFEDHVHAFAVRQTLYLFRPIVARVIDRFIGAEFAGLVSNDDALAARLLQASKDSGDAIWRMPLAEGYRQKMKSVYADLKNSGGREGGSLTAAAFLERFVDGIPWAHVDIPGVAWTDRTSGTFSKGATGFGVRLVTRLLETWR